MPRGNEARPERGAAVRRREWLAASQVFLGLGCLFAWPPSRTLACCLSAGGGPLLWALVPGRTAVRLRATWSSFRGRDTIELERELRASYRSLFETPGAGRVDLVESRFRATARPSLPREPAREAGHRARALEDCYAEAGFSPGPIAVPPDHLAVQLHCLGSLLERASGTGPDAARAVRQAQTFLRRHLLMWLPSLVAAVAARREGSFYATLLTAVEADARAVERDLSGYAQSRRPRATTVT